jgi:hypothetical protein
MLNDDTALEGMADELAAVAVCIAQHTGRFLELLGELDRAGFHAQEGYCTMADWLAFRVQMKPGTAREHLRVARALLELPKTLAALKAGTLSFSQVRAITRVADAESEAALIATARHATAAQLERIVAGVHRAGKDDPRERIEARREARLFFDDDGMLVVRARLAPEEGAVFLRAMDEARRQLWERPEQADRPVEQARVDAFALIAERALGGTARTSGDRAMVVIHVDEEVLRSDATGESRIVDAAGVSAETSRRLSCDASLVAVSPDGSFGRRTRTIGAALRRALDARDEGRCRFPGCSCRVVDAHHVVHFAKGGATELSNLTSLCRRHHVRVHEGGYRVEMVHGEPRFFAPNGKEVRVLAPDARPELRLSAEEVARHRLTLSSRWDGARPDYAEIVATLC